MYPPIVQPRLKNVRDIGTLICTSENYAKENSNCRLDSGDSYEKTFRIYEKNGQHLFWAKKIAEPERKSSLFAGTQSPEQKQKQNKGMPRQPDPPVRGSAFPASPGAYCVHAGCTRRTEGASRCVSSEVERALRAMSTPEEACGTVCAAETTPRCPSRSCSFANVHKAEEKKWV